MTSRKTPFDLDLRTRDRNLQKGLLSSKDIERHLKELPDMTANSEPLSLTQPIFEGQTHEGAEPAREGEE